MSRKKKKQKKIKSGKPARDEKHKKIAKVKKKKHGNKEKFLLVASLLILCIAAFFVLQESKQDDPSSSTLKVPEISRKIPHEIMMSVNRAVELIRSGQAGEAVKILEEDLEKLEKSSLDRKEYSSVHYSLCVALQRKKETAVALKEALNWLEKSPDDFRHNLIAGSILYDQLRYAEAVPLLEKGIKAPVDAILHYSEDPLLINCQLADCYRILGKTRDAERVLKCVLSKDKKNRIARRTLSLIAYKKRNFPLALKLLESLWKEDHTDPFIARQLAKTSLEAGKSKRVLEVVQEYWAVTKGIRDSGLKLLCAKAFLELGDAKKSAATAEAVLVLDPEKDEAYFVLANAMSRLGKAGPAKIFRERYMDFAPSRAAFGKADMAAGKGYPVSAMYYRACAYNIGDRFGPALLQLSRARKLAPRNGQFVGLYAQIMLKLDRPFDAQDLLNRFQAISDKQGFPLPAEFFLAKAHVAETFGRFDEAASAIKDAIGAGRCERDIAEFACHCVLLGGKPAVLSDALKSFKGKVELDFDVQTWYAVKSLVSGNSREAVSRIESALQSVLSPKPFVYLALARAYLKTGSTGKACRTFQKLVDKEALLSEAWEGIRDSSKVKKETGRAASWLQKASELKELIRREGQKIQGESDLHVCADAIRRIALFRAQIGYKKRARNLILFARDIDKLNVKVHRAVLNLLDRPEDLFERIHSLEILKRLLPGDTGVESLRKKEYQKLQL